MKSRGPKARGYDTHKKEKYPMSSDRKHKKPVPENEKTHRVKGNDKRAGMIFMDSN